MTRHTAVQGAPGQEWEAIKWVTQQVVKGIIVRYRNSTTIASSEAASWQCVG